MLGVAIGEREVLPLVVAMRRAVLPNQTRFFEEKKKSVLNRVFIFIKESKNFRRLTDLGKARQNSRQRFLRNQAEMFRSQIAIQKIIERITANSRSSRISQRRLIAGATENFRVAEVGINCALFQIVEVRAESRVALSPTNYSCSQSCCRSRAPCSPSRRLDDRPHTFPMRTPIDEDYSSRRFAGLWLLLWREPATTSPREWQ